MGDKERRTYSLKRRDVIHAVRLAAKDAAKTSTNPMYMEALDLAVQVLESGEWTMPKRRAERIRGRAASEHGYRGNVFGF